MAAHSFYKTGKQPDDYHYTEILNWRFLPPPPPSFLPPFPFYIYAVKQLRKYNTLIQNTEGYKEHNKHAYMVLFLGLLLITYMAYALEDICCCLQKSCMFVGCLIHGVACWERKRKHMEGEERAESIGREHMRGM